MASRQRSPSIEIVSVGHPRKTALVESTRTANNQSPSRTGLGRRPAAPPAAAKASSSAGAKRKSLDAPTSAAKRTKTTAAPKENSASGSKVEEKKDPAVRWKWIDSARPEFEMKGTKIEAFNCGGTFFKSTAKNVADRLDKLEGFLAECEGDETCHPSYGYPERYKPKRVTKKKGEPEDTRWQWIDKRRPEMRFKGTKIEAYNCGGAFWKATGKTVADRLDKMESFFAECKGDEAMHDRPKEERSKN
ncbi:hypothetical protein BD626DRAFT_550131 [Schizophyllum amplum]|uniref:Uncharacterized protein n=1 Tax=Schizophyllum amplum TaxID=97359 RepID=A0A550C3Y4_9AGAR|nr:hypothetical protein BD626DRAFT_550131 [Auriculariopsis ampla]